MFHVGNFTPNFHRGLNPGPPAPLASVLPLRHKVKELPGPKIWKVIDLSISLVFRQIEQIHLKTFSMQCCTVRSMTSYIFGPGDSLTSWRSGRILAKGARGPGFNPRWKLGVKFPTWNISFLLFLRSIGVQYDPQKILFQFIKLQTLPPSNKRGVRFQPQ